MPEWVARWLPDWAEAALVWIWQPTVLGALAVMSVGLLVASAIGIPYVAIRTPVDYFVRPVPDRAGSATTPRPPAKRAARFGKNLLGLLLLLLGIVQLVLPGQGVLTILVALLLLDFPGKFRLERRIVAVPRVLGALNALRRRAGRPPLRLQ